MNLVQRFDVGAVLPCRTRVVKGFDRLRDADIVDRDDATKVLG